jgi:hypothetical protein
MNNQLTKFEIGQEVDKEPTHLLGKTLMGLCIVLAKIKTFILPYFLPIVFQIQVS